MVSQVSATVPRIQVSPPTLTSNRQIQLGLLGGFEVTRGGNPDSLPLSSQRVVAFLAVHARPLQRVYVAGTLWPDVSEDHANACLRSALWRLRRRDYSLVEITATYLRIQQCVAIDFLDASARARRLLSEGGAFEDDDYDVIAPARELLPDVYEEWAQIERERFRQLRLHALEALCDRLVACGRYSAAVRAGLAAVEGEPLRESAQRALIRAHFAEGNPGEALRQYRSFKRLLHEELGLAPSAAIRTLFPVELL